MDNFVCEPMLCEITHVFAPLQVLTHWSSLYTCLNSQVYICYIINTLVYKTTLCKTYVCLCPCDCSHFEPLVCIFLYTYIHKYTFIISYEPKLCNSNPSVPLQVLTLRTSLDVYIYSQVYTYHISDTFAYEPGVVRTHICLFPGECSPFEACFIHTYIHK